MYSRPRVDLALATIWDPSTFKAWVCHWNAPGLKHNRDEYIKLSSNQAMPTHWEKKPFHWSSWVCSDNLISSSFLEANSLLHPEPHRASFPSACSLLEVGLVSCGQKRDWRLIFLMSSLILIFCLMCLLLSLFPLSANSLWQVPAWAWAGSSSRCFEALTLQFLRLISGHISD